MIRVITVIITTSNSYSVKSVLVLDFSHSPMRWELSLTLFFK